MRWDTINFFIEKYRYTTYLEIGYYKGWSFDRVKCKFKTAVDPNPCKFPEQELRLINDKIFEPEGVIYKMTSDQFFRNLSDSKLFTALGRNQDKEKYKWDIIFIDGLHEREQVLRDLKHAFNHLSDNGIIIMHDCNPPKYEHTTTGIDGCWTGDVYKAMLDVRNSPEAEAYVIDIDWGVGVVKPIESLKKRDITETQHFNALTDWDYFDKNRKELLNLIDISTFVAKERYNIIQTV